MDGFGIQVSIKTANDTLINVRGDDPDEFDMNLSHAVEKIEEIHAAEAAFRGIAPQTTADGVGLLKTVLGAQVIGEYDNTQAPPQAPPGGGYQMTHCGRCKTSPVCKTCNRAANVVPRSVKDGQYWIHDCPSGDRAHKGSWCNEPK